MDLILLIKTYYSTKKLNFRTFFLMMAMLAFFKVVNFAKHYLGDINQY